MTAALRGDSVFLEAVASLQERWVIARDPHKIREHRAATLLHSDRCIHLSKVHNLDASDVSDEIWRVATNAYYARSEN